MSSRRSFFACWWVGACLCLPLSLQAQGQGGGGQGGGQGGNQNVGGILIDAAGVIAPGFVNDTTNRLDKKRQAALASVVLDADLRRPSPNRKVSLVRLAEAVEAALASGEALPQEVRAVAGVTRIDALYVDPERRDLVIAGPAEGFAPDETGRLRGIESGRPTLWLEDLAIAFRTIPANQYVGCSIDPVPEQLAAFTRFVAQNSTAASPQVIEARFRKMAEVLGNHDVSVSGVPADSRFARILVAADYRMKRISMGLEAPGVKGLRSHLAMLGGGGNSLQRWWFVPYYEGLYRTPDGLAFEWTGPRLQLLSQEEVANSAGERQAAATTRLTTQGFAKQFTERFPDLANQSPVFAELQALTDWCLLVAVLEREGLYEKLGWQPTVFRDAERWPHVAGPIPQQVPAMANAKRASSGLIVGLVGGGVTIDIRRLVPPPEGWSTDPQRRLDARRAEDLAVERPMAHPWWWD